MLLVGFEPEEESPIVFLRLRKAARKHGAAGLRDRAVRHPRPDEDAAARCSPTAPGAEAGRRLGRRSAWTTTASGRRAAAQPGAVILVGERLATVPGALSAAVRLADATGARLAWVPRRAGERGALEAGALPSLLPGGRPADRRAGPRARSPPPGTSPSCRTAPGRDTDQHPGRRARRRARRAAGRRRRARRPARPGRARWPRWTRAGFVVSLELRHSAVTERADVVFPVAPVARRPARS